MRESENLGRKYIWKRFDRDRREFILCVNWIKCAAGKKKKRKKKSRFREYEAKRGACVERVSFSNLASVNKQRVTFSFPRYGYCGSSR